MGRHTVNDTETMVNQGMGEKRRRVAQPLEPCESSMQGVGKDDGGIICLFLFWIGRLKVQADARVEYLCNV